MWTLPIVEEGASEPPSPRPFRVRRLLTLLDAALCGFALLSAIDTLWLLGGAFVLVLVGGHVLGNALGTRLRDESTWQSAADREFDNQHEVLAALPAMSGPHPLGEHLGPSRTVAVISACGAFAGAELGGVLAAYNYPEAPTAAVFVGVASMAVLGAIAGFAISGFFTVARAALRAAQAASRAAA